MEEPDELRKSNHFSIMWKHAADVLDSDVADITLLDIKRIQEDSELNGKFEALLAGDDEYQRAKQEWTEYWSRKFRSPDMGPHFSGFLAGFASGRQRRK